MFQVYINTLFTRTNPIKQILYISSIFYHLLILPAITVVCWFMGIKMYGTIPGGADLAKCTTRITWSLNRSDHKCSVRPCLKTHKPCAPWPLCIFITQQIIFILLQYPNALQPLFRIYCALGQIMIETRSLHSTLCKKFL